METHSRRRSKSILDGTPNRLYFPAYVFGVSMAIVLGCVIASMSMGGRQSEGTKAAEHGGLGAGAVLQLDSPALPETELVHQPDFDFFAWNSFIAMFWPALDPGQNNNQRGFPDLSKTFIDADSTTMAVWETFKEKREVFNFPAPAAEFPANKMALPPWNHPLDYGPLRKATDETFTGPTSVRVMATTAKQHQYNSFDETLEVVSEAFEPFYPDGKTPNPIGPVPGVRSGRPVGPRVWRGEPSPENAVFFEVKVNYDYYRYVKEHNYNVAGGVPPGLMNTNTMKDAGLGLVAFP